MSRLSIYMVIEYKNILNIIISMHMVAVFKPYLIYLSEIGYPLVTLFARYLLINVKGLGVSGARFYEKITFSQHKLLFCLLRQTHLSRGNLLACLSHRKHFCP